MSIAIPRSSSRVARTVALALPLALSGVACSVVFDFSRDETEVAGTVRGRALREDDGQPASYARVRVQGYGIDKTAAQDGAFYVSSLSSGNWVFDLISDEDNNGWPERRQTVKARVTTWAPPLSVPAGDVSLEVPFIDGVPEPLWISVGDVLLSGSVALKGSLLVDRGDGDPVSPAEAGYIGRVFVVRDECFLGAESGPVVVGGAPCPSGDDDVEERLDLGAESRSGVDARGFFGFQGLRPGTFSVVAALYAQGTLFEPLGALVALSAPVAIEGEPGDVLSPGTDVPPIVLPDPNGIALDELVPIEINISPSHDVNLARVYPTRTVIIFTPSDAPRPPCTVGFAGGLVSGYKDIVALEARTLPTDRGFIATLDAPVGSYDLQVCTDIGEGTVEDVVIFARPEGSAPPRFGPARARYTPLCGDDTRDCDDDALAGLPPLDTFDDAYAANRALWAACAETCAGITTPDVTAAVCTVDGVEYDCDDDGDLQADVTEHPNCYGPGLGADRDGDGLCDGQDPFPLCASNDPELCDPDRAPDQTTTLSPVVADPRCQLGPDEPELIDGEACRFVGDPDNEPGCNRVRMKCEPREAYETECRVDEDCADGAVCSRRRCMTDLCETNSDCAPLEGAPRICHEGVCRVSCGDDAGRCAVGDQCTQVCADDNLPCRDDAGQTVDDELACVPLGFLSEGALCSNAAECGRGLTCAGPNVDALRCMRACNPDAARPCPSSTQQCCPGGVEGCEGSGEFLCTPFRIEELCLCEDLASELSVEVPAAFAASGCDAEGAALRWPTCNLFTAYLPDDLRWDAGPGPTDAGIDDAGALDAGVDDAGAQPTDAGSGDAGNGDAGSGDAGVLDAGASLLDGGTALDAG